MSSIELHLQRIGEEKVQIFCSHCGTVNFFKKEYFSHISDKFCINNAPIKCYKCNYYIPSNSHIEHQPIISEKTKERVSSIGSFFSVLAGLLFSGCWYIILICIGLVAMILLFSC